MKKLLFISFLLALVSCEPEESSGVYKPISIGTQGRIDVIMPDLLWNGRLGEIVKEKVAPLIDYYPNEEYLFDLAHSSKTQFNSGSKKQKNLLEFEINSHDKIEAGLKYSSDIWAIDQAMVKIIGKTQQDLYNIFMANSQEIQDHFMELEIKRMKVNLLRSKNHVSEKELLLKHNLSVTVPKDMVLSINNKHFAAFQQKRLVSEKNTTAGDLQQFLIIYDYPYTDKSQLTKENLLQKRDSVVKKYFRGKKEDSYMITAPDSLVPSFAKETLFKGNYAFEIRGLYSMVNDFRGGPFINISLIDEKRGRIVTLEGHLFAPKFSKRPYMMELETMLNTLYIE
jgi:hypothetical protein|tara:strand:+ start:5124 stop:6140 length:1017 start_codon:yes stop_codon:yes gene_type:complete